MGSGIAAADRYDINVTGPLLRQYPLFAGLSDEQLNQVLAAARPVTAHAGDLVIAQGDQATSAYVIVSGELEILRRSGEHDVLVAVRGIGEVIGEMGLFADGRRNASARARSNATLLEIQQHDVRAILESNPAAAVTMLRTVMERFRAAEAQLIQHQKMVALGTLAAGVAHELNNPGAAVARSAGQLRDAVVAWERAATNPGVMSMVTHDPSVLADLRALMSDRASATVLIDPITRADREDALVNWLESAAVERPWVIGPQLVDAGWEIDHLQQLRDRVPDIDRGDVIVWLAAGQTVFLLLRELTAGATSISSIVSAVKAYTRLDQAPIQDVDLHLGIDETLTILRSKLGRVRVRREYAPDIPHISSYASELNQVWTNLIDNAIDAMDGVGDLVIRTSREGHWIVVEVRDNGSGIAPEVRERLFEPFFTTKPPGQGTGLGLSISYSIVRKHGGEIVVMSEPGCTNFQVRLPIDPNAAVETGGGR